MKRIDVAVGVVCNAQQQILISRRAAHQHQGNRWEFPGGKVDGDESVSTALSRELHEELGVEVQGYAPLCDIEFNYPDKAVRLHVFWIDQFSGNIAGREGQEWQWVAADSLVNFQFPDANQPILAAIEKRLKGSLR